MKNLLNLSSFVFLLLLLTSCSSDTDEPNFPLHAETITNPEDYEVYSTIINNGNVPYLVLNQVATSGSISISEEYIIEQLAANIPDFDTNLVTTLINSEQSFLGPNFNCDPIVIHLTSPEELDYAFNNYDDLDAGWLNFFNYYNNGNPIGLYQFSRVAYNTDSTKALVELSTIYGSLAGEGYAFYLEKENNEWIIRYFTTIWMS